VVMAGPVVMVGRWQDTLPGNYDPTTAVVITDPPYGLAAGGGIGHMGLGVKGGYTRVQVEKGYEDTIPWSQHVEEVLDLLPAKRHAIRGPATALIRRDFPQPRRVCIEVASYRKRALNRPGIVPYLWQGWAVYGRLKIDRHARPPKGDAYASSFLLQRETTDCRPKRTAHRALTGCTVIDPFAGLGTIGLAARLHGFDYIGAELDPEFAAVANTAFETEALPLGLEVA
jgi:hypothetical protein